MILKEECFFPIEVGEHISLSSNGIYETRLLTFGKPLKEHVIHYPRYTMHCDDAQQTIEIEGFAHSDIFQVWEPVRVYLTELEEDE